MRSRSATNGDILADKNVAAREALLDHINDELGQRLPNEEGSALQQAATNLASVCLGPQNGCILFWAKRLTMLETPLSKFIRQEAIKRLRAECKAEGELVATQGMLFEIVQDLLGHIPPVAQAAIEAAQDVLTLKSCVRPLLKATNEAEVLAALAPLAAAPPTERNGERK